MPICGSCGRRNPAGARFCNACAAPLGDTAAAREERKVVTVLFADLVGFTARAERMDPEDVRELLRPLHARLRAELDRRGGTVEKFIGDAVMAVFGAPVAHEDDPERAVRAALAIRDAVAADGGLELRIGITTGEALIALDASPQDGEGMASGDVVNTAARLQAAAPSGAILVDETTFRATERAIEYRPAPPVVAKGKTAPIPARLVVRASAPIRVERASDVSLVGRARELALLRDTLARVVREREPQLVTLVGVPGIGKSRLLAEVLGGLEHEPEPVRWLHGRSLPYGDGVTFWALGEMVKAHAGILESDTAERTREKLGRAVASVVADPDDAAWVQRLLQPLAGLDAEDAGDRTREAFTAWRQFLEALAEERPVVLAFEDLHWADDALLDFVEYLLDWAAGVPILVLATARPELLGRRPGWGGGTMNSATLRLSPLSEEETQALLVELLGAAALGAEAQRRLLDRAGGNPLYAEEFVRMLTDRGEELTVPESVQGIIAARLDSLPAEEKDLLHRAAVLGRVFWAGALAPDRAMVEQALHPLERKEFLRRARRSSVAGEAEYAFSHALVRDVAYEQIPRAQRVERHLTAAAWIESLGRPEDHAEMLAHHYGAALAYADATGAPVDDLAGRATHALREAAQRAFALNAYPAAVRYYERALATGARAGWETGEECDLLLGLAEAQARSGDMPTAKATYLTAAGRARELGAADRLARAALGYGGRFVWARAWGDTRLIPLLEEALAALPETDGDLRARLLARLAGGPLRDTHPPDARVAMASDAVAIARRLGDGATLAYALDGLHCADWGPDVVDRRREIADELIRTAEAVHDAERVYAGHDYRFYTLLEHGDVGGAEAELNVKTGWAQKLGQPAQLWDVAASRAMLDLFRGRFAAAEAGAHEALELGRSAQTANAKVAFDLQLYGLRRAQGRPAEVADLVERAVGEYPAYPVWRYVRADVLAQLGRIDEARAAFEDLAATGFEVPVEMQWLVSLVLMPELCRLLGDRPRAEQLYAALRPYARHNATTPPELSFGSVARGLGILAATMGDWEVAIGHFADAREMNAAMGARPWLAYTEYDHARMLHARDGVGDREEAGRLAARAAGLARELGMGGLSADLARLGG